VSWLKVDDGWWRHPKIIELSKPARSLWVMAGAWCADQLTDGHLPRGALKLVDGTRKEASELVASGLWDVTEKGWRFHDWSMYQPSREQVLNDRAAAAERQKRARAKARESASKSSQSRRDSRATGTVSHGPPDPTRPDPTFDLPEVDQQPQGQTPLSPVADATRQPSGTGNARGTRLPEDFPITDALASWAREHAPMTGPMDHDAFCDYWRGVPGAKGRKVDWDATWRNWMRKASADRTIGRAAGRGVMPMDRAAEIAEMGRRLQQQVDVDATRQQRAIGG